MKTIPVEPSLKLIYDDLTEIFDNEFAYLIIRNIRRMILIKGEYANNILPTLGINNKGELIINHAFWHEHMQNTDNRKTVLMHELMHTICGDTHEMARLDPEDLEFNIKANALNIAADARINAYISLHCDFDSRSFFTSFYNKETMEKEWLTALVRPSSLDYIKREDAKQEYQKYYNLLNSKIHNHKELYNIVLDELRNRKSDEGCKTLVIGKHGAPIDSETLKEMIKNGAKVKIEIDENSDIEIDSEDDVDAKLKEAMEKQLSKTREESRQAGIGSNIQEQIFSLANDISVKLDLVAIKRLNFDSIFNNVRVQGHIRDIEYTVSPVIPQKISKRDILLLSAGVTPIMWRHEKVVYRKKPELMPIYLDVSGSMHSYLPEIMKMIVNVDEDIDFVWGFSNVVEQHTMEELKQGKIKGTGGTDFDCVINHAKENNFSHIVLITDGYAHVSHETRSKYGFTETSKVPGIESAVTILIDDYRWEDNYFSKIYNDSHDMHEVCL